MRRRAGPTAETEANEITRFNVELCSVSLYLVPPPALLLGSRPFNMEIPQSTTSLERHSDLWFDDGSVVCRAENTLFRVHMSQLARHSECFRDMFSLAQPSNKEEEVIDGCPVLVLQDTAEDVASLFCALYDGP